MHLHLLNILENDNSTTIHNRNFQLLVIEIVKNGLSPTCMNEIFEENAQHYDLRKKTEVRRNNVKTVYNGTETLTFLGPKISSMESRKLSLQILQKVAFS